jgi:hypothetical protein
MGAMIICCEHKPEEHHVAGVCQQVIHYPSEDYPCFCTGLVVQGDVCAACEHTVAQHIRQRVCRPEGGEFCGCRRES